MIWPIFLVIVFLYTLVKASDYFVDKISVLAIHLNIKKSVIALILVAVGASLPELVTAIFSVLNNEPSIMVGNVFGSTMINLCLIIPVLVFFYSLEIPKSFSLDILIMFLSALLLSFSALDSVISFPEALSLIVLYLVYIFYLLQSNKAEIQGRTEKISIIPEFFEILFLLIVILFSAQILVTSILELDIPSIAISTTIVSFGTALPNFTIALSAIKRKEYEIIFGELIGSNIIVPLFVIGLPSLFIPTFLSSFELFFLLPIFFLSMFFGFLLLKNPITKTKAGILLLFYIIFVLLSLSSLL